MIGAQTGPSVAHSRPLRGGCGAGMGVVIPCAYGGPWTGDNVGIIPLKPNAAPLELSRLSTVSTSDVIAQYG
ncbi:hypothetical protein [Nitrosomonas communis]|uniref:hypothetical protein n=1 Tax=Nitrosomonas communis TaxID=44574 RepID=UPI00094407F4|nr:hypothetical protein [Nitrosomonas communis]